jgi:FixJ family two-component response regulator
MTRSLLDDVVPNKVGNSNEALDRWASLSERERDVLRMVALGHTNREMERLALNSRSALVRFALANDLLEPD